MNRAALVTRRWPIPPGAHVAPLVADDGTELRAARWCPTEATRGTVVVLNGRTEYIEKYLETVSEVLQRGFCAATLDWRGQGMSERALPKRWKGHVERFDLYQQDVDALLASVVEPHCPKPWVLLAHSMGGNIGLHALHRLPGVFERAIFSAPMWGLGAGRNLPGVLRAIVSLGVTAGGGAWALRTGPKGVDPLGASFEGNGLTGDRERYESMNEQLRDEPELTVGAPTLRWIQEATASIDRLHAPGFPEAIQTPVCVCTPGADGIVSQAAQAELAARLPRGAAHRFEGARHEILLELDRYRKAFWERFDAFTA